MSRKSVADLSVARDPVELDRRLPPPQELTPTQAVIWNAVVATKPADWFQADCAALLVAYCRHITTARNLDQYIDQLESEGISEPSEMRLYKQLLEMREKQTRAISTVGTKLRLTPQSRYDEKKAHVAHKKTGGNRLWDRQEPSTTSDG